MDARERAGVALATTATTMVGSAVAASSLLVDYPALSGQAGRYAAGAAVLALVLRLRGRGRLPRLSPRDLGLVLALAATGLVGFNLCLLAAVDRADPAVIGLVIGCAPVLLALVGPPLAGRPPTRRGLLAAVVVVAGAALAQGGGRASAAGLALAVGALGGEAAFSLLAVPLLPRLGPIGLSVHVCAAAAVLLAVAAVVVDGPAALAVPTGPEGLALAWLGLVVTALGFVAWYSGVARLGVERAGLFAGLIPVAALASVAVVGTSQVTPAKLAGSLVVGAGILVGLGGKAGVPVGPIEYNSTHGHRDPADHARPVA
jgi:drug/metabolite transporter (DMT)-like permease